MQWNFSSKRTVTPFWSPSRLKAGKLGEVDLFEYSSFSLSSLPPGSHPLLIEWARNKLKVSAIATISNFKEIDAVDLIYCVLCRVLAKVLTNSFCCGDVY